MAPEVGVSSAFACVPTHLENHIHDYREDITVVQTQYHIESNFVPTSPWGVRLLCVVQYPESHQVPTRLGSVLWHLFIRG